MTDDLAEARRRRERRLRQLLILSGINPPWWWKPWLRLYWVIEWWYRPREVKPPRKRGS